MSGSEGGGFAAEVGLLGEPSPVFENPENFKSQNPVTPALPEVPDSKKEMSRGGKQNQIFEQSGSCPALFGGCFSKEIALEAMQQCRTGHFFVRGDQSGETQFHGCGNVDPVDRSQKNRRFRLEGSDGNFPGAGFDIDAEGNQSESPPLQIGLETGRNSSRTRARNFAPRLLGMDGKGHFIFENGTGVDRALFQGRQFAGPGGIFFRGHTGQHGEGVPVSGFHQRSSRASSRAVRFGFLAGRPRLERNFSNPRNHAAVPVNGSETGRRRALGWPWTVSITSAPELVRATNSLNLALDSRRVAIM